MCMPFNIRNTSVNSSIFLDLTFNIDIIIKVVFSRSPFSCILNYTWKCWSNKKSWIENSKELRIIWMLLFRHVMKCQFYRTCFQNIHNMQDNYDVLYTVNMLHINAWCCVALITSLIFLRKVVTYLNIVP